MKNMSILKKDIQFFNRFKIFCQPIESMSRKLVYMTYLNNVENLTISKLNFITKDHNLI